MNPSDFEKQLEHRPLRPVPAEWRAEILAAARASIPEPLARPEGPQRPAPSFLSTLNQQLSAILWPCPQAWAGLAAVWLVIAAFNHIDGGRSEAIASRTPPAPETIIAAREERQQLARLIEPWDQPDYQPAEPPKPFVPRPRGELRTMITLV